MNVTHDMLKKKSFSKSGATTTNAHDMVLHWRGTPESPQKPRMSLWGMSEEPRIFRFARRTNREIFSAGIRTLPLSYSSGVDVIYREPTRRSTGHPGHTRIRV